jgi:hypothetical protein
MVRGSPLTAFIAAMAFRDRVRPVDGLTLKQVTNAVSAAPIA